MDDTKDVGEQIVKKKMKPRGGNNILTDAALNVKPGDNAKYLGFTMKIGGLPTIDLHNGQEVRDRLEEYFTLCAKADMKPTVSGMALALGNNINRQVLWAIKNNQPTGGAGYTTALPPEVADSIKKAYAFMESLWENYMQNGKINPVSGIFLGKNNYGYKDQSEYVLTPNSPLGEKKDPNEIAKKYALEVGSDFDTEE